jgi:hypothetical protein
VPNADVVWVDVLPSMNRFGRLFDQAVGNAGRTGGQKAGAEFGAAFEEKAAAKVAAASKAMSTSMRAVEDAAGRVRVAQQRLIEVQESGRAKASQLAAAQEAVARAERQQAGAKENLAAATKRVADATDAQRRGTDELGASVRRTAKDLLTLKLENDALDRSSRATGSALALMGKIGAAAFASLGSQAAVGGLVAVAGAASGAAGAIGLVPAAAVAAAAPVAALRLGLVGMEDAFKALADGDPEKLAEALGKLAPSAAAFVREASAIKPAFDSMRLDVQEALFAGLGGRLGSLASVYLPLARTALGGLASDMNSAAHAVADFFTLPSTAADLGNMLSNGRIAFQELTGAARPIVQILTDIGAVGSTFLPGLAGGFTSAAQQAADFVSKARESGRLREWISSGLSVLGELALLLGNVGRIIFSVFSAGQEVGGGFISTLRIATGEVARFLESPVGQSMLATFFTAVGNAVRVLAPLLGTVGQIVLGTVVPALSALAVQLAPIAQQLLSALLVAFQRLAPLMPQVGAAISALVGSFIPWIPILTTVTIHLLPPLSSLLQTLAPVIAPVTLALIGLTGAMRLFNTVSTIFTLVTSAWTGIMTAIRVATQLWSAAQFILNLAMNAFPGVLIATALIALGAALVIAYQRSETFRNIVDAAFRAVGAAGIWLWENALRPAFDWIVQGWNALTSGVSAAWTNVLYPAWQAVAAAAGWLWNNVLVPAFNGIMAAWSAMVTAIQWAWTNILEPTWNFIKAAADVLFQIVAVVIFGAIYLAWLTMVNGIQAVWNGILRPLWDAVQAAARFMWENVLRPVFDLIRAGWDLMVQGIRLLWENVLRPAWSAVEAAIRWLWDNVARPIFEAIRAGWDLMARGIRVVYDSVIKPALDAAGAAVDWVGQQFDRVVRWIGDIWNGLKELVAAPIRFVIDTVYNNGIVGMWNKVADLLPGVDPISPYPLTFAAGGQVPAYAAGGQINGQWRGPAADNLLGIVDNRAPIKVNPKEWIHPVGAVNWYGDEFMRAVQRREFPRELAEGWQHFADGGRVPGFATGDQIFAVTRSAFPRAKVNSTFRPGDKGYHGKNQAADMGEAGFPGGAGRPYIADMKRWWVANYGASAAEIIYDGLGNTVRDTLMGAPHTYSLATQQQHYNHLHVAHPAAISGATGGPGGTLTGSASTTSTLESILASLMGSIADLFETPARALVNSIPFDAPPRWRGVPKATGHHIIDKALEYMRADANATAASQAATAGPSSVGVATTNGPVQETIRAVASTRGWGTGAQWDAINWIISKESGWRPTAQNPVSTASGLFQHIDATWRAYRPPEAAGFAKMRLAPVNMQGVGGFNYIGSRYGTPTGARAFWEKNGWYAGGGQVLPEFHRGGHTGHWRREAPAVLAPDERVLDARQDRYFQRFVDATAPERGGGWGDRKLADKIEVHANTRDQGEDIVNKLWHKVRVADRGGVYTFTV